MSPNQSLQRTHPAPRNVMPVAIRQESMLQGRPVIVYHVLCAGVAATGTPLLGSGCSAELPR